MELTISKKEFLRSLNRTHSVADRKSSMPMLANILLSTDGKNALRFAATDLYLAVTTTAHAEVKSQGTLAVSARTLFDVVKSLPEGDVQMRVTEAHAAELRAGKVRFKLPGMPGQDFPALPSPGNVEFAELSADALGQLVTQTQYSMSHDETRPHLAGALVVGDGKVVRMVTTDGHRLSKSEYKQPEGGQLLNFEMLVPAKGIAELKRVIDEARADKGKEAADARVGIATTGGNAFFRRGDLLLSVKLADEQFPPYSKVIPSSSERKVVVSRGLLIESLKRISLVANDKSGAVRFAVEPGLLRINSENPDVGEGSEELDVDFAGTPVEIGFNARYLLDVLGALTEDEVSFELGGQLDPGVIRPVGGQLDFVGVVMPMRI